MMLPQTYTIKTLTFPKKNNNIQFLFVYSIEKADFFSIFFFADGKPYFTDQKFPSRPLTEASTYCQNCGMQLCTLAQMQEAYINGFRSQQWGMFEKLGYDTSAFACGKYVAQKECYVVLNSPGAKPTGIIPVTPRVGSVVNAWCCGK